MILGIQFASVYPEPIHRLDNGLTVFKSKFFPHKKGEIACIGGPIESIQTISSNMGATNAVKFLANYLNGVSAGYAPRINFFPSSDDEMERRISLLVDKDIPNIDECLENEEKECASDQSDNEEIVDEVETSELICDEPIQSVQEIQVSCVDCGVEFTGSKQTNTVQAELRKFFDQQGAGLDSTFRCLRCRDCKLCLKGAGEEKKSLMEEAQQHIIRESVYIDRKSKTAVASMPFISDPTGKLINNTRIANKRLENVCRKYGSDAEVRDMIIAAFQKLISRGHIIYLKDLSVELQKKINNAKVGYTIPWDVAFKEGSLSTPARPVFDASSKTPGGSSLNDLLAKGSPDMVRLIDMLIGWRIGPSAFIGDIRQFYNNVRLRQDGW